MGRAELVGVEPTVFASMRIQHVATSDETLSKYVRTIEEAGIDMKQFTLHSEDFPLKVLQ